MQQQEELSELDLEPTWPSPVFIPWSSLVDSGEFCVEPLDSGL